MVLEPANLPDLLHLRLGILQLLHIRYCGEEKIYGYSVTPMRVWFLICPRVYYDVFVLQCHLNRNVEDNIVLFFMDNQEMAA